MCDKEPSLCTARDSAKRAVHYTGKKTNPHFALVNDKETKDNFKSKKKNMTSTDFEVCLKDIQRYNRLHDPITVNYITAGFAVAVKVH
ncbi:uncharacterized protein [Montipora capricornis]|uniref:uncharacterized protein n=1 Tax=Montipora capricornis TaxID=246305 RepID=UPI0035F1F83C